jgi:hypothetical protein
MNRCARFSTLILGAALLLASTVSAQPLACSPCAGVSTTAPYRLTEALAVEGPELDAEALFYVAYPVELDSTANPAAAHAIAAQGATPWIRLRFRTAPPFLENLEELRAELDAAASIARSRPDRAHYQVDWIPPRAGGTELSPVEYGFLVKRASVAITGEDPDARVVSTALPPQAEWLRALWAEEIEAYLDLVAFSATDEEDLTSALAEVAVLDPGKPVALVDATWPEPMELALTAAAADAERGASVTLFRDPGTGRPAGALTPLKILANEFRGELTADPYTRPSGATGAWSFVRGEDLSLRVVLATPPGADRLTLLFPDPQLRTPVWVPTDGGDLVPLAGARRTAAGLEVRIADPGPVVALRLERAAISELEGIEEELTIADERRIPVEEVLRRLQAFEDAQARRVRHWQAVNSTTLRFQAASGVQAVEATFEGEVFYRAGQPFDWAWQRFLINGILWRSKTIPEIPLVQPEKAAAMPLEVHFTKEYRYSLRGTETVSGRDCWVVEFEPDAPVAGRPLFRGAVWVDRATSARVRTRAIQLGLQGEVLSNEETIDYQPVAADGIEADWGPEATVLPLRTIGQQLLSVVNTATVVEREVVLSDVVVNGADYDRRREEVLASDVTMVRDTESGLRYLVPDEDGEVGERVVKEGFDSSKLFVLGGVFYDESLDFPLPLAGVNYFDLNFRGGERQLNAFFAGVLGIVNYADPRFMGSTVDLGVDLFAIGVASSDTLFRGGIEQQGEEVEELPARITFNFGFPIGSFVKVSSSYRLAYSKFSRTKHTTEEFVLPSDHLRHQLSTRVQFARSGYRLSLDAAFNQRTDWEPWGLPGNSEYDPRAREYTTWEASAAKNWYLPGFRKIGLELNYLDGDRLDRFSKYQFGFFGGSRVHGYQIGKVRAEKALAAHATYGFEIGKLLRLDAVGDVAWATDSISGLDREMLAGVGIQGTFVGPWQTLVQLDVGSAVAGPDDGIVAYLVFLKLFD